MSKLHQYYCKYDNGVHRVEFYLDYETVFTFESKDRKLARKKLEEAGLPKGYRITWTHHGWTGAIEKPNPYFWPEEGIK